MVSIIIPTLNGKDYLKNLLPSIRAQSIKSEATVVDSSSTDDSSEIASQHGVRVLEISRNGFNHGHTRNLGAQHVKKDILVFLTQDALPTDDYCLENLIKP
ncbi:MAG: glycosyltransferase, partial [Bacteroidetes bacterium]|nr:glycosyltransferase [Prolixibacteraceae bacterium]MBP8975378.1 glycosyltransferase [Bacteroidota bacterium]